jgi:hypothetical protein
VSGRPFGLSRAGRRAGRGQKKGPWLKGSYTKEERSSWLVTNKDVRSARLVCLDQPGRYFFLPDAAGAGVTLMNSIVPFFCSASSAA